MALADPLPIPRPGTAMPGGRIWERQLSQSAPAGEPITGTPPAAKGAILGDSRGTDNGRQQQHHRGATDRCEGL